MKKHLFEKNLPNKTSAFAEKDRQPLGPLLLFFKIMMSSLLCVSKRFCLCATLAAFPLFATGQTLISQGEEFAVPGAAAGDQVQPHLSLNEQGGFLVWEGTPIGKTNSGIAAARLDSALNKVTVFPVSKIAKGTQRSPKVQLLNNSQALFVWSGNALGNPDIYARLINVDGTFLTSDLRLNLVTKDSQSEPAVTFLQNGGAFAVWQSFQQDGSLWGIYGRTLSSAGEFSGTEFLLNQATAFNQRSPALTTLSNGNVVVVWISEQERFATTVVRVGSVDVYARLFTATGNPLSDELLINSGNNVCANPSVAPLTSGGFTVVWSEKDLASRSNSWEIMGRSFSESGLATGSDFKINANTYGDQFRPKIASGGDHPVVVWTSLGQDGSREGVYARVLPNGLLPLGSEFRVNTTTASKQIHPTVSVQGPNNVLIVWSSFVAINGFDLFGQKYFLNQQP